MLWAHAEDRTVPLDETVQAFGEVYARGQAERIGCSNHATWRLERARRIAADLDVEPYSAIQLRRSYIQPRPGATLPDEGHVFASPEALAYATSENLSLWVYTPLLNGSYVRDDRPFPEAYNHRGTTRRLAALQQVAESTGATPNQVVLAWLMKATPAVSPIVGVSSVDQLTEAMAARDVELGADHLSRLNKAN